jgi:hypothetical protein
MPVDPRSPPRSDSTSTNIAAGASPELPSTKAKIAERLTKAVKLTSPTKNRSPELIPLTVEYEKMKKKLRTLVTVVKKYTEMTEKMQASRDEVRFPLCTLPTTH